MMRHKESWLVVGIFLLALGLRLYGISFGLPYKYHSDEEVLVLHALKFGTGDLNPHWFLYPSLYMYLLFFLYGIFFIVGKILGVFHTTFDFVTLYFTNASAFYLIGRSATALLGSITSVLLYLIGKRLFNEKVGMIAAFFLATTFLHIQDSHYITTDVPMTFMLTVSFYFCARVLLDGDTKYYILAGLFAGLAGATKYTGIIIVLSLLCAHFLRVIDRKERWTETILHKKLGLGSLFVFVGFLIGCPYSILDFETFWIFIIGNFQQSKVGWLGSGHEAAWLKVFSSYLKNGLGIPLEILSLAGVAHCLILRKKEGLLLISFPMVYYLLMAGSRLNLERYWIPIFPMMVLVGAKLIVDLISKIPFHVKGYAVLVVGLVMISPAIGVVKYDYLISQEDTRTIAKRCVETNIPAGTKIVLEKGGPLNLFPTKRVYTPNS